MSTLAHPLIALFDTSNLNVQAQLADLDDGDATRQARHGTGSSISWGVGHMLHYRCEMLKALGIDQPNAYKEMFSDEPANDGNDYPGLAHLLADWKEIHAKLKAALESLSDAQLSAATDLPNPHGDRSLASALSFLAWHEAYHAGVIGLLRVQWGQRHTHEVVMESLRHQAT